MKRFLSRLLILAAVVGVLVLVYLLTPIKNYTLADLFKNRDQLLELISTHYLPAVLIYIGLYIVVVAFSIPGATILTLLGGFFFNPWIGVLYINIGATVGAYLVFLAARFFLGEMIQNKYADKLEKFNREMDANGKNYLLTLRLIPIFPFFLINLMAGLTKVPSWTFIWTTALGIIPGSFAYAYLGYAGASIGEAGMPKELIIALVLLTLLSLFPVVWKKLRAKKVPEQN